MVITGWNCNPWGFCKVRIYLPPLPKDRAQSSRKLSKQGARLCQIACLPLHQGMMQCATESLYITGFTFYLWPLCSADFPLLPIDREQVEFNENVCESHFSFLRYCKLMIRQHWSTRLEGTAGVSRSWSVLSLPSSYGEVEQD